MQHDFPTAADYAQSAADEANRKAQRAEDRIKALEKEVARLWRAMEQMQKEARRR